MVLFVVINFLNQGRVQLGFSLHNQMKTSWHVVLVILAMMMSNWGKNRTNYLDKKGQLRLMVHFCPRIYVKGSASSSQKTWSESFRNFSPASTLGRHPHMVGSQEHQTYTMGCTFGLNVLPSLSIRRRISHRDIGRHTILFAWLHPKEHEVFYNEW